MSQPSTRPPRELPLVAYGASFALFSSFGQTFLISVFVPSFTEAFSLSDGGFGALYSAATLASAAVLPWAGKRLDHVPLPRFSAAVVALMVLAAVTVSAARSVAVLGLALVGLRLAGQGLATHTAYTVTARYGGARRGRIVSLASLGFPAGEAVLPLLAALAISGLGWRGTWGLIAAIAALVFLPLLLTTLSRAGVESEEPAHGPAGGASCLGMTMGLSQPVRSSLWAELYGVRHLGAIKAMIASLAVLGAAGSPVLIGAALDAGVHFDHILVAGIATTVAGVVLAACMDLGSGADATSGGG